MFIIINKKDASLVWVHNTGWVEDVPEGNGQPTIYDQEDIKWMRLPVDGEWLEL